MANALTLIVGIVLCVWLARRFPLLWWVLIFLAIAWVLNALSGA